MNKRRSLRSRFSVLAKLKGKSLIVAFAVLVVGVISVAIGAGVFWAIGFASIAVVLLILLAASWQQARTQTERFQQLRNQLNKLSRAVARNSVPVGLRNAPRNAEVARPADQSVPSGNLAVGQMFDIQRELDYLLWRISSVCADKETALPRKGTEHPASNQRDGSGA